MLRAILVAALAIIFAVIVLKFVFAALALAFKLATLVLLVLAIIWLFNKVKGQRTS